MASEIETGEASSFLTAAVLRDTLEAFAHLRLCVTGECMNPELVPGDTVFVVSTARRPPRFGNVVLAVFPSGPRLHRLVWRPPIGSWRTKADRGRAFDPPLSSQDILGTVVGVEGRTPGPHRRPLRAVASLLGALCSRLRGA